MAQNSLNQIVVDAASHANGNTLAGPNIQSIVQNLAPAQSQDNLTSALTEAARQVAGLVSTNQTLVDTLQTNTAAVQQSATGQGSSGRSTSLDLGHCKGENELALGFFEPPRIRPAKGPLDCKPDL